MPQQDHEPSRYRPLPPQVDLPAMEREVLAFWHENDTFAASLEQTADGEPWTFYEGPPTANGQPGTHHVEARVFKDVFPRFKTMQGYHVVRKAGWDCHGLPVELAVEKELGFSGKGDIEAYGVAEFNARCRESVLRHVDEFEAMTERMGYWVDMDAGLLDDGPGLRRERLVVAQADLRQGPARPRTTGSRRTARAAAPALSDHELAAGLRDRRRPVGLRPVPAHHRPVRRPRRALLVWTTTPWTLVSNTAVAVHPDVTYVRATDGTRDAGRRRAAASSRRSARAGRSPDRFTGADLERWTYQRPFELVDWPDGATPTATSWSSPTTSPPRTAPAWSTRRPPSAPRTSRSAGRTACPWSTRSAPTATSRTTSRWSAASSSRTPTRRWSDDLDEPRAAVPAPGLRALLPALLALPHRAALLRAAVLVHPHHRDQGRAARRERADQLVPRDHQVGPLRRLAAQQRRLGAVPPPLLGHAAADLALRGRPGAPDLRRLAGRARRAGRAGPLRARPAPAVRRRRAACALPGVRRRARAGSPRSSTPGTTPARCRSPSGATRTREGSEERFDAAYPAQFICEAIDQTRGWFYTLMAVGTLVFDRSSYENVLCLGHILAEDGRKMSKHLGNILRADPADGRSTAPTRCAGSWPPAARRGCRAGSATARLQEIVRKMLLTYWNTASFLTLYADANDWVAAGRRLLPRSPTARRWTGGRCPSCTGWSQDVTAALEAFDTQRAGRLLAGVRRRPVQLVRPPVPPPVLGRRPGRAGDAARVPGRRHAAAGAVRARSSPSGSGRTSFARRRRTRPTRCTWRPGRRSTARWSTTRWPGRSRWSAGWSSSAGPPARSRRCATGSRCGARWSAHPAGPRCPTSCAQQVADELNVRRGVRRARRATLVDRQRQGATSGRSASGSASGTPPVAAAIAAADAGELAAALRSAAGAAVAGRRRGRRADGRRGDHHRDAAGGLGGGDRRRRDRGAGPRRSRPSCAGPDWPARWSGWCRRPASPPGWRSPTGSSCGGRRAASWPRRCASTARLVAAEVLATSFEERPRNRAGAHRRGPRPDLHRHPDRPSDPVKIRSLRGQPAGRFPRADVALR